MVTSLVLLLVLEGFWLRGAYLDAAEDFQKQANLLFRNTVFVMHDSLVQRSFKRIDGPLSDGPIRKARPFVPDSLHVKLRSLTDTTEFHVTRIEIISTDTKSDSLIRLASPFVSRLPKDAAEKRFIFQMGSDTLSLDTIRHHYRQALDEAGIKTRFRIHTIHGQRAFILETSGDRSSVNPYTSLVSLNPRTHYVATFDNADALFLREIAPQMLFSIFLTVVTAGSFHVMHRHLRAQQRLMEMKNDFISNVTHELKTPVATVSVALEALRNFRALENPQRTNEYLDIAENELKRLTLMTDRILKTTVFDERGLDLNMEKIDLAEIAQQVISSMKVVFERRGTEVRYLKTGTNFELKASEAHLTNVLFNLIDNALKYSAEASSLEIALTDAPDKVCLAVKDSGMGIAKEFQDKIFQKFFRVPSGDVHNTKGYGLGLSYVHSVVKHHGGNITVESEPGKGSEFIIELPRDHEDEDTLR